jgi:cytochrome c biogenesis protein
MTVSTQGIEVRAGSAAVRSAIELLSSMRFAISLLSVICIASVIGTVLRQNEPATNYVNAFGPFWAEVFSTLQLPSVYSAWWFLLILAFLVLSTSLCIIRNTPKILTELRAYKENIREQSLKAFGLKASGSFAGDSAQPHAERLGQALLHAGWKVKLQERPGPQGSGWMIAAKTGAANKLGYIAAHSAIVLVCIGGLLDGDMMVRAQMWFNDKQVYSGGGLIGDVPEQHKLSMHNPTFRGNILVTEGTQSYYALLNQPRGLLVQELPFSIELKKFIVEYYSTGMPKLFASDIVIHDRLDGTSREARVEVNHPVRHRGIDIFQSSFDDGGSGLTLQAVPMAAGAARFEVKGAVGASTQLTKAGVAAGVTPKQAAGDALTLEYTGLRVINVENFAQNRSASDATGGATDVRTVDLRHSLESRLGAANKTVTRKELRNVGPSVTYKLRDGAGQAREFHNYMLPVDLGEGGPPVFLLGVREDVGESFRYLRLPADDQGSVDGFMRLKHALADPALREQAVRRYAATVTDPARPDLARQLAASGERALGLFAGEVLPGVRGLQAVADFMEANVPEAERARAGEVLVRLLNGALFELAQLSRTQAGLKPLEPSEATQQFMTQAVFALSDVALYPAPMFFLLKDFQHVQASVFQVARAPGRYIVYLGCAFLIVGIFAMLYVRERRLWVWLAPDGQGRVQATLAQSSNRRTLDGQREFEQLSKALLSDKELPA